MKSIVPGSLVKMADITDQSVPAYKDLRGTVIEVGNGWVKVKWDCDGGDVFARTIDSIELVIK